MRQRCGQHTAELVCSEVSSWVSWLMTGSKTAVSRSGEDHFFAVRTLANESFNLGWKSSHRNDECMLRLQETCLFERFAEGYWELAFLYSAGLGGARDSPGVAEERECQNGKVEVAAI